MISIADRVPVSAVRGWSSVRPEASKAKVVRPRACGEVIGGEGEGQKKRKSWRLSDVATKNRPEGLREISRA